MTEYVSCRFFGGPVDGRVMDWEYSLAHGVIQIPEGPMFNEHWLDNWDGLDTPEEVERRHGLMADWFSPVVRPMISSPFPRVTSYRWDGTVSETGERRMRWSGRYV